MKDQDKFQLNSNQKAFRAYMLAGGAATTAIASASPVHAQSTGITVDSVSTQLTSTQTAIVSIGGVLLAMAMGILLFTIGRRIIKGTTKP